MIAPDRLRSALNRSLLGIVSELRGHVQLVPGADRKLPCGAAALAGSLPPSRFYWQAEAVAVQPVLFLIFNRPDTTEKVFEEIRKARPAKLYVAADGARAHKPGEAERCLEAKALIQVDWDCEVQYLYQTENLGCKAAIMSALDWFFEHEEKGIILEDDCVPNASFWRFCSEMLVRYEHDPRVATISGSNYELGSKSHDGDFYFSRHVHIWGWATWRRTWQAVDKKMTAWPTIRESGWLGKMFDSRGVERFWRERFDRAAANQVSAWSYYLLYSIWTNGQVCINPSRNLVSNIGAGEGAVHCAKKTVYDAMPTRELAFPLSDPATRMVDEDSDAFVARRMYTARSLPLRIINRLRREIEDRMLMRSTA